MHIYKHRVQEQDNPLLPKSRGKAKGLLIPIKEYSLAKSLLIAISTADRNAWKTSARILTFPDHTGGKKVTGAQD